MLGGDHQAHVDRWDKCLRCERDAWDVAMRWCLFSPAMFAEPRRGLGIYRGSTPGPASAVEALDRTRGTITLAEQRQRQRRRWQDRVAQVDTWKRDRTEDSVRLEQAEQNRLRSSAQRDALAFTSAIRSRRTVRDLLGAGAGHTGRAIPLRTRRGYRRPENPARGDEAVTGRLLLQAKADLAHGDCAAGWPKLVDAFD